MKFIELQNLQDLRDEQNNKLLSPSNFLKLQASWYFLNPTETKGETLYKSQEVAQFQDEVWRVGFNNELLL